MLYKSGCDLLWIASFTTGAMSRHTSKELSAENLEVNAVKGTSQIRKSQGSSKLKVNWIPNLIKAQNHIL